MCVKLRRALKLRIYVKRRFLDVGVHTIHADFMLANIVYFKQIYSTSYWLSMERLVGLPGDLKG